ncbi:hypothetical protein INT45_012574 [Circinella minor]|uniref:SWIM-type domain-containing protein n=1 Tax=Circinella minor TaxID=1195481 RepID=A0A8H7S1X5_9FUNG|nr:hypothetical protein INT45_012574 [Circinella minor]
MENYLTTTFITRPENDGTAITVLPANEVVPLEEKNHFVAGFTAFVNKDSEDKNMITVQYRRKHTGHESGSNIDTTSGTLPRFVMKFIQAQVEKSLTWRNIKHMLRLDKDVLENILDSENYDQLPQSVRIDYHHVYYVMKIHLRRQSQHHPSMADSLIKWGTKIQNERGYFTSKNLDRYEEGMFFSAFMSQWQLKLLKENGDLVCLDSTHKTCVDGTNHDCYLYTLVARCRITGKGKPLTWMITNSQAQYPILYWLQWLKDEHGYVPSRVMIDDSNTEIAAINKAYNTVNDDVSSGTYTDNKNILTKLTAKPSTPSKTLKETREMRETALSLMMNMMRAETPVDFDLEHEKFETWCIDVDEEWDGPELYQYFEREFLRRREKWSQALTTCKKKYHHHVNTNNYIETWHRQLKDVYLASLRRQRVDVLVYILWGLVLPDLMQDHLCTVPKFRLRTMNKAERRRLAHVNELNEEEAAARIVSQEGNTIKVLSFTDENITYDILIDADNDFIVSCTCPDNQTNDSQYKHMYLVCIDTRT